MPDEVEVTCPYCGEPGTVRVSADEEDAEFVQDCAVCCRPWHVRVRPRGGGPPEVTVAAEGD
jgi:transcription elongation factor Elf1